MTSTPDHVPTPAPTDSDLIAPQLNRRAMIQLAGIGAAATGLLGVAACSSGPEGGTAAAPSKTPAMLPRPDSDLPPGDTSRGADNFFISDQVTADHVTFGNQFGQQLSANLFVPKNLNRSSSTPAVVVSHPMGAVKEQSANLYAQKIAEQGFVTLAVDLPYWGGSQGEPRNLVAPDNYAESFSAGVDYLRTLNYVAREQIGALGICGSGSYVISAAKIDPRIKAVATASMYDMGAANRFGLHHSVTLGQRREMLAVAAAQRDIEFVGGQIEPTGGTPEQLTDQSSAVDREFFDFYRTARGHRPNTTTHPTLTSNVRFLNYFPFNEIDTISPRPMMFIAGDQAHSLEFSQDAYQRAAEPKELVLVPGAGHVDLYDRVDLIPFERLAAFYRQHLT
ncbi:alpha/beta hydrolase [Mycobacteroides salmoniphilum]|uniref:Fermentation/respiration switch protein n=1 Tax=Mycobacteroides salmoniphilum TaxID=404941 RepID=A0A4R8SLD5_9MYCO|nr:alpha/beta hydrolase [Mycobacteroides salmoniphilum]TDZ98506.1 fermentation/respiration switch protein [Mycobacteroides salmoniphilum]TEA03036.1 fermentation/respiration switch protein [Mycobacteroides salmoniphilum]